MAFDDDPASESSTSSICNIGLQTINDHLGTVESVRFLLSSSANVNNYLNGVFEVSEDGGTTWSTLYTV